MVDDKIADAPDRDGGGSLAGTKQQDTINFAQTNWIAFVARAKRRRAPEAGRRRRRSPSIIAEVALISLTEDPPTIKYHRAPRRTHLYLTHATRRNRKGAKPLHLCWQFADGSLRSWNVHCSYCLCSVTINTNFTSTIRIDAHRIVWWYDIFCIRHLEV